jgi:large subunit ribosomal protein L22
MEVRAVSKYARLSADKARDLVRRMRGLPVNEALKIVDFSPRKAAVVIGKALRSAIANAENNRKLSVEDLRVTKAVIDEGPALRRYWARARGMVRPIRHRTCHVTIVLSDGEKAE